MDNDWSGVESALQQFGLPAKTEDRLAIIQLLREQIQLEDEEEADQFLMRLLCAQLFSIGNIEDCIVIWEAKSCCFDNMLGIDVQFLCGAGLEETKRFLRNTQSAEAKAALDYINECQSDFAGFSVQKTLRYAQDFYE